jgi:hypothetical protein
MSPAYLTYTGNYTVVTGVFRGITVVVSPVEQIAYVYRNPKPAKMDHTQVPSNRPSVGTQPRS